MWWNERFSSWMWSQQICINCVMLSCQYGPKPLRNVSNTLLNLCHEELRQLWRQKGVQPSTSKLYLIKWPVSVCVCIYIYIYTEQNYKCNTFVWAELKDLRLFLRTQKAYFSQILFKNLSKSVLVSTSPLPRLSIHLTGVAYQDADYIYIYI